MQREDPPQEVQQQGTVGFLTYDPDRELVFETTLDGDIVEVIDAL